MDLDQRASQTTDIVAICAHPDDMELCCAGLLLKGQEARARIGSIELSRGEMGSRGTVHQRMREVKQANKVLNLDMRLNLHLPDGGITVNADSCMKLVNCIRKYTPRMLITSYWQDHHPDHRNTSLLVKDAAWFAGVKNYPAHGSPHRPELILYYLNRYFQEPDLIVDISSVWLRKKEAIRSYHSQLYDTASKERNTYTSNPDFMAIWESHHRYWGSLIGVPYGEAYLVPQPIPIVNPMDLIKGAHPEAL